MSDRTEAAGGVAWIAVVGPEVEENLSLRYIVATVEQAGVRAEIYPFNAPEDLTAVLRALLEEPRPFLIALSLSFQWRALDVMALAMALREQGYQGHITGGGHFASLAWESLLGDCPEIDSLCRFEAEETFRELCLAVRDGRPWRETPGIVASGEQPLAAPTRPPPDLAGLPWPDRRGEPSRCLGHVIEPIISSRGCYANCAFCCIATLHRHDGSTLRHRLRPADDVAEEMAWLARERRAEIFIFHDDNFFLPREADSLRRIEALADAVERRGLRRFATVVKARPNDVTETVFRTMRERFGLLRLFLGVESSTHQGCRTLGRGVRASAATEALARIDRLGIYACYNLLVFDPDASIDDLLANMAFLETHGDHPANFGRVELYAGTPLLARLQNEGRAVGDYLSWDYDQGTPEMQRVFELAMDAFYERNFGGRALANRLQSTRFDAEVAGRFHPERVRPDWVPRAKDLCRRLAHDSAAGVRRIVDHVRTADPADDRAFTASLAAALRACEERIDREAASLEHEIQQTVGASCVHAPVRGIPIPRRRGAPVRVRETVRGYATAEKGGPE
jgi:radical SAM superfamily enzyme YgiQ (UPF0313 family)